MAEIYFAWRFGERFTLNASGSVTSIMTQAEWDDLADYIQLSGSTGMTWFLTDRFTVRASFSVTYRNQLLSQPFSPETDPAQLFAGGGNYGDINYMASIGFSYSIGNAWSYRRDQRWVSGGSNSSGN